MKVLGRNQLSNVAVLVLPLCTVPILNVAQEKHLIPIDTHPTVVPLIHTSFYEEIEMSYMGIRANVHP